MAEHDKAGFEPPNAGRAPRYKKLTVKAAELPKPRRRYKQPKADEDPVFVRRLKTAHLDPDLRYATVGNDRLPGTQRFFSCCGVTELNGVNSNGEGGGYKLGEYLQAISNHRNSILLMADVVNPNKYSNRHAPAIAELLTRYRVAKVIDKTPIPNDRYSHDIILWKLYLYRDRITELMLNIPWSHQAQAANRNEGWA